MSNSVYSNKRIAKNTLIVYCQMAVSFLVALISSRLVLQALGASDFGLYGVVGGVISMFTFISSALSDTTTRFLNYEMGKTDGDLNRVFNISLMLHIVVALVLFLLLESLGYFYIQYYLNVDPGREEDAMFVFHISTVVACVSIINIPYTALFAAYEKFGSIATIEIFNSLLKLLLILLLFFYEGNALRFYAICMSATTFVTFIFYRLLAKRYWADVIKKRMVRGLKNYKDQLSYNGWSLLSTFSIMGRGQGSNLLVNYFFNTTVNAAFAISSTVQASVEVLSANFTKVASPQITKSIGENNNETTFPLIYRVSRYNLLLSEITFFTLFIELEGLLKLWLGSNIPPYTLAFCQCTLIIGLVASTACGIVHYIRGVGRVREFYCILSSCFLLALPLGFMAFAYGYPPYTICVIFIVADAVSRIAELYLLKRCFSFNVSVFLKESWGRPLIVFCIYSLFLVIYRVMEVSFPIYRVIGMIGMLILSTLASFFVGLYTDERRKIIELIKRYL